MKFTIAIASAILIALAGPLAAQDAPAATASDLAGPYDFTTTVDGTRVAGTIRLEPSEEGLTGSIDSDLTGSMPIRRTSLVEEGLRIEFVTPNGGPGTFLMRIEGSEIAGPWQADGMAGEIRGARRP